jgi:Na+/melibiose symporter-like transporter
MKKLNKILFITFFTTFVFYIVAVFIPLDSSISRYPLLLSITSILMYLIIRISSNDNLGFKRLSIILAIIGLLIGFLLSILTKGGIVSLIVLCPFFSIVGMLIAEAIIWVMKGFKPPNAS